MGYTTKFQGHLQLSRKLTIAEAKTLLEINDLSVAEAYAITGQRSYLQWVPDTTLDKIVWDDGEKFYDYIPLLRWLCADWLASHDIVANGEIYWFGESSGDCGVIRVSDNVVTTEEFLKLANSTVKPMTLRALQKLALDQLTQEQT